MKPFLFATFLIALTVQAKELDPITHIQNELGKGAKTIVIPKGKYPLDPGKSTVYLRLKGLRDVTIDFNGSEFLGKVRTRMIHLTDCTNVVLRNLTIDYPYDLPFTQAVIKKVEPDQSWLVEVIDGYPFSADERGDGVCWPIQVYDRQTHELKNPMRFRKEISVIRTGERTYRISGGIDRRGEVGDIAVWSVKDLTRPVESSAIQNQRGVRCRFENITEYATPHGCAFNDLDSEASVYDTCRIVRRPPETDPVQRGMRRLRSGNHDAFMSRCHIIGPKIIHCEAKYHCDDCVNISGMYCVILSQHGRNLRVAASWRGVNIDPGDQCQVMTYDGRCLPDLRVTSVHPAGNTTSNELAYLERLDFWPGLAQGCRKAFEIKIDRDEKFNQGSIIVSNRRTGNGFEIIGCDFGHSRARGLLIKASYGRIVSNRIERCAGHAMQIATEYEWLEGGCSRNIDVIGNFCKENGSGIYIGGSTGARKPLPADSHYDLALINNTVIGSGKGLIINGCTGLTIRGNDLNKTTGEALSNVKNVRRGGEILALYTPQDGKPIPGFDPIIGWTSSQDPDAAAREWALARNHGIDRFIRKGEIPANAIVVQVNRRDRRQTPVTLEAQLRAAKQQANDRDIVIDGWNDYKNGKWILCDFHDAGELWMRAVSAVFGRNPAGTLVGHGSRWSQTKLFEAPVATFENIAYGPHWKQRYDIWLPKEEMGKPIPVLINCHGGGWTSACMVEPGMEKMIARCRKEGIAYVAMQYRFIQDANHDGIKPPVKACLEDCAAVLRHLATKTKAWNLDMTRVGMTGGSAGGASALWTALSPDCPPLAGVVAVMPQTTLDPLQARTWLPALEYGAHAWGYRSMDEALAQREKLLPEIRKWSPTALLDTVQKSGRKPRIWVVNPTRPKEKETPFESIHSPVFCREFKKHCDQKGVDCTFLGFGTRRSAMNELISYLKNGASVETGNIKDGGDTGGIL